MSEHLDTMTLPAYPAARSVAATVEAYFASHLAEARQRSRQHLAPEPDAVAVEAIIDAAFWASLRREEGYAPKISLAFLPPEQAGQPLTFERRFPLTPPVLSRLAPAVERPGIHLGVWRDDDESSDLRVWGTTRSIPKLCFVLEVIEPGLLVVKYRRGREQGKYVNVAVLKGDQIKMVDDAGSGLPDCPELVTSLLSFGSRTLTSDSVNVLVQLSVSMRAHGRGGSLLVVPQGSDAWRRSILQPVSYLVAPPFSELAELMRRDQIEKSQPTWQEALVDAVDAIAGLTAVDGAALISDEYELLAFGAKIGRRADGAQVEQVIVTEPIVDGVATVVHPLELGGTRHLSAAQFVQDQPDSVALVASVDGRFTIFAWSPCEHMVHAHRVETLLM
ncbi:MAG: putative sensor domain DACNV-containing protein [Pyrinomonadaceae bacterium]